MTKVAAFDTSVINQIMKDPERGRLVEILRTRYVIYISALNILEIAKTKDVALRENLREFINDLAGDRPPLDLPNHLVRQTCRLFAANRHDLVWSISGDREGFAVAMSEPESISDEERLEANEWARDLEGETAASHARLRQKLEADVFPTNPELRPRSAPRLLKMYLKANWQFRYQLTAQIYKRETGKVLPLSRLDDLLESRPSIWPLYLMACAFAIHYAAFWTKKAGPKNRTGIIDLLYAVYLPLCDVFVTHDTLHGGQYDALRVLNVFNSRRPRTHVLNWNQFRGGLLREFGERL